MIPPSPWHESDQGYPGRPEIVDANGNTVCLVEQRSGHPMVVHPETRAAADAIIRVPTLIDALRHIWRTLPDGDPLRDTAWFALEPVGGVPPLSQSEQRS